jgi:Uncharacterized protein related to plant photosystem II stability/assembly factor
MKKFSFLVTFLAALLCCESQAQDRVIQTTAKTRALLRASTASEARAELGIVDSSVGTWTVATTPWATTGTLATNSTPWTIYTAQIASNPTNAQFPCVCYDFARRRLIGSYLASDSHYGTNSRPRLIDSYDGGKTWVNDRAFPNSGWMTNIPHFGIGALQDGSLTAVFCQRFYNPITYGAIYVLLSSDGGLTWTTNSTIGTGQYFFGSQPVFETGSSTWLLPAYFNTGQLPPVMLRTDDRGSTWSCVFTNTGTPSESEGFLTQHPYNGTLFWVTRSHIFTSTNNGVNWKNEGVPDIPNQYASYPACAFIGNRLLLSGRSGTFGNSTFWYSDTYPYINGWTQLPRSKRLSIYDYPVKLSESVVCWLSSLYPSNILTLVGIETNGVGAVLNSDIVANDGLGWSQPLDYSGTQPQVWLRRSDIPASGRMTVWNNWGNLGVSPTNNSVNGAVSTYFPGGERAAQVGGFTNVNFGVSNLLASLWQTNQATVIWRDARTNSSTWSYILDNKHSAFGAGQTGFGLYRFGQSIICEVANSTGTAAGNYTLAGDTNYTGEFHVSAIRLNNENMWAWQDGAAVGGFVVTNSGSGLYTNSANSFRHLSVGSFGDASSGQTHFLSDLIVFTNALSDAEIYAWMSELKKKQE